MVIWYLSRSMIKKKLPRFPLDVMLIYAIETHILTKIYRARLKEYYYHKIQQYSYQNSENCSYNIEIFFMHISNSFGLAYWILPSVFLWSERKPVSLVNISTYQLIPMKHLKRDNFCPAIAHLKYIYIFIV